MSKILILGVLLISYFSLVASQSNLYKIQYVSQEQGGAACLDGSPPAYYIHEGFGANKNNFLLYFQGGGFCGAQTLSKTLDSCYARSKTNLGSSKDLPPTLDTSGLGILSTSVQQNQLFYDWTKVAVAYCDGSEWAGYRENPIPYKDQRLHFRGSKNVKQVFNHINKHFNMYNGGSIVITGTSAGGVAAFQWANYLQDNTKTAKIYSLPDSGFFITDFYSAVVGKKELREKAESLLELVKSEQEFPQPIVKCMKDPGFDVVDCFNAANYAKYLRTPIFMVQSPYDQWSMKNIVVAKCLTNKQAPYSIKDCDEQTRQVIEQYRLKSIEYLKIIKGNRTDVGIWGPACVQHGYEPDGSYNNPKYQVQGTTVMKAIERFLNNPTKAQWLLDQFSWPGNQGCSGLSIPNLKIKAHNKFFSEV